MTTIVGTIALIAFFGILFGLFITMFLDVRDIIKRGDTWDDEE